MIFIFFYGLQKLTINKFTINYHLLINNPKFVKRCREIASITDKVVYCCKHSNIENFVSKSTVRKLSFLYKPLKIIHVIFSAYNCPELSKVRMKFSTYQK